MCWCVVIEKEAEEQGWSCLVSLGWVDGRLVEEGNGNPPYHLKSSSSKQLDYKQLENCSILFSDNLLTDKKGVLPSTVLFGINLSRITAGNFVIFCRWQKSGKMKSNIFYPPPFSVLKPFIPQNLRVCDVEIQDTPHKITSQLVGSRYFFLDFATG